MNRIPTSSPNPTQAKSPPLPPSPSSPPGRLLLSRIHPSHYSPSESPPLTRRFLPLAPPPPPRRAISSSS
ncbi:hypothetical protein PVAP13_6KG009501 [Panicum virgatum]|uniref:Uncharacterized protein n=1 Tax=Panicum virgatum TaxID=38727 RepID=A0A8T0R5Z0_PANVG|nr:hypothetical protein PVAP13_6KG009501 [Panicum virgatum]